MNYTEKQNEAINSINQNLQIIACAGSGKTRVVTARIVNILKSVNNIKPRNIVAFTFTEKAADELKTRIYMQIKEDIGEITGLSEMYIGTIHGFCLNMIQEHLLEYQKFTILDEVKTKIFIDKYYDSIGMKTAGMKKYTETHIFINFVNILRESDVFMRKVDDKYKQILNQYDNCFMEHGYFDFTMIMQKAVKHLEKDPEVRKAISNQIKYLTVDEYQDVNPIQEKLIRNIYELGANICVVGDEDQTIYQWRGSEIENILNFKKRYNVDKAIILSKNFRSSEGIIDISTKIINNNEKRRYKDIIPSSNYEYQHGDTVYQEFQAPIEECKFIIKRIKELVKHENISYSDIAILLRIKRLANELSLIDLFQENKIDFIIEGVNELFSTNEAKGSQLIFDYLNKQTDKEVLRAVWNEINYNIDSSKLDTAISNLDEWYPNNHKFYHNYVFQKIFQNFIDDIGLKEKENEINKDLEIIMYNLGKISQVINDFETIYYKTSPRKKLRIFCEFLTYTAGDYYPEGYLQNKYLKPDAVRIMTIHQAKGLEFKAVFIPGLSKNIFPLKKQGGKNVWHYLDRSLIKNAERYVGGNIEDERRLFYVAATRSKKALFLTRSIYNKRMNKKVSEFLIEAKNSKYLLGYDTNFKYEDITIPENEQKKDVNIILNFSVLKDYYHCPYRFKLSFFYGFIQPIHSPMGYGRSMHNCVMEIHKRFSANDIVELSDVNDILDRHFHLPYAHEKLEKHMREKAEKSIKKYLDKNKNEFSKIELIEKPIEIDFGNGVRVTGKIDLVKKGELGGKNKIYIIDFKTMERSKIEEVTEEQLSIYAIGYKHLSGINADYIEIYNLDNNEPSRKVIQEENLNNTEKRIMTAANNIRSNKLNKEYFRKRCEDCYLNYLCLTKELKKKYKVKEIK